MVPMTVRVVTFTLISYPEQTHPPTPLAPTRKQLAHTRSPKSAKSAPKCITELLKEVNSTTISFEGVTVETHST